MILVIVFLLRASLAAVLVAAGAAKLADTRSFAITLIGLGVPARRERLLRGLALTIPLVEMGVGVMVVSGFWPAVTNGVLLLLMCSFSIVVIVALLKNLQVKCRCFGALSDSQFSGKGLVRSLLLTVLASVVFWAGNSFSLQFEGSPGIVLLLIAGYLVFAVVAAQAATSIAVLKERMNS